MDSAAAVVTLAAAAPREIGRCSLSLTQSKNGSGKRSKQAERVTKGEIVPMIVPASALYREAGYRTGLILALLALALSADDRDLLVVVGVARR